MSSFKISGSNFPSVFSDLSSDVTRNSAANQIEEFAPPVLDGANSTVKCFDEQVKAAHLRKQIESCWTNKTAAVFQTDNSVRSNNPNGIVNAVEKATGLARVFGNVNPRGVIGHDGVHVVAPVGSKVKTLPALEGKVIDLHDQGDGTYALDVLVNKSGQKPFVVIYKDIAVDPQIIKALKRGEHPTLKTGDAIGKTAAGGEGMGVHVALLRGGQKEHDYYRLQTRTKYSAEAKVVDFSVKLDEAKKKGNTALIKQYEQQLKNY